jgi:hypothetical protein
MSMMSLTPQIRELAADHVTEDGLSYLVYTRRLLSQRRVLRERKLLNMSIWDNGS